MSKSNTRLARTITSTDPTAASWQAFDDLPQPVRLALWEAPVAINPLQVADLVRYGSVSDAVRQIKEAAQSELRMFSADHRARYGSHLPHVEAQASLQPYRRIAQ